MRYRRRKHPRIRDNRSRPVRDHPQIVGPGPDRPSAGVVPVLSIIRVVVPPVSPPGVIVARSVVGLPVIISVIIIIWIASGSAERDADNRRGGTDRGAGDAERPAQREGIAGGVVVL